MWINPYNKADLDRAANNVKNKYNGWVDPTTHRVDWISPNNLEQAAKKKGMVSAEDYQKVLKNQKPDELPSDWKKQLAKMVELEKRLADASDEYQKLLKNQKPADYDSIKSELNKWKNGLGGKTFEQVQTGLNRVPELEKRPTQETLNKAVKEETDKYKNHIAPDELEQAAKKRGMFSKEEYDKVVGERDARPNISLDDWNNDYKKRPKQTDLDQLQAELNKVKGLLGLSAGNNLPANWENQLVDKNNLDEAAQKVKNYEDGLKDELGLTETTLSNWKDEIDKLKKRPASDNSEQIKGVLGLNPTDDLPTDWTNKLAKKDDLKAVQDDLKKWTDKFGNKDAAQVEKENKKAGTADDLQKELDNWKNALSSETPQAAAEKITNADRIKDELNKWQGEFPSQSADAVLRELNDLRAKPTGATSSAEQQRKIDDLIEIIKKQNKLVAKYGNDLQAYTTEEEWKNEMIDISKLNK